MIERKRCDSVAINELRAFTYPLLHTGKEWYVGFNAFDPVQGKMRRKKIKINSKPTSNVYYVRANNLSTAPYRTDQ